MLLLLTTGLEKPQLKSGNYIVMVYGKCWAPANYTSDLYPLPPFLAQLGLSLLGSSLLQPGKLWKNRVEKTDLRVVMIHAKKRVIPNNRIRKTHLKSGNYIVMEYGKCWAPANYTSDLPPCLLLWPRKLKFNHCQYLKSICNHHSMPHVSCPPFLTKLHHPPVFSRGAGPLPPGRRWWSCVGPWALPISLISMFPCVFRIHFVFSWPTWIPLVLTQIWSTSLPIDTPSILDISSSAQSSNCHLF